jgi:hypothetical protein
VKRVLALPAILVAAATLAAQSTEAKSSGPIVVKLPKHVFGHFTRPPDAGFVDTPWGTGKGQVGLATGAAGPTGGSSWDVVNDVVCILDQHASRVVVYKRGTATRPIPLVVPGAAGRDFRNANSSLAVGTDGTIYVLEPAGASHKATLLSFPTTGGKPIGTVTVAGSSPIVRAAGKTAYVAKTLSGPWVPTMKAGRPAIGAPVAFRPFGDGSRVQVASGSGQPIVLTLVTPEGVKKTWRVSTPDQVSVADAEAYNPNLLLVLKVSRGAKTEYEVVVLGSPGVFATFSVPYYHYTATAPFDDFRVDSSTATLFHRGSTKKGFSVDYYSS